MYRFYICPQKTCLISHVGCPVGSCVKPFFSRAVGLFPHLSMKWVTKTFPVPDMKDGQRTQYNGPVCTSQTHSRTKQETDFSLNATPQGLWPLKEQQWSNPMGVLFTLWWGKCGIIDLVASSPLFSASNTGPLERKLLPLYPLITGVR